MKTVGLAGAIAALILGVGCPVAQAAAAVIPTAAAATPVTAPSAGPSCGKAKFSELAPLLTQTSFRSIVPATAILPIGDESVVDMVGPLGASTALDDYHFRIFVGPQVSDPAKLKPRVDGGDDGQSGIVPQAVNHPTADSATALHLGDPTAAYELHFEAMSDDGVLPWRSSTYVVVACQDDRLVGWGGRPMSESRSVPVQVGAGLLMAVIYLLAATMAYLAREQAIREAPEVQQPLRVAPVDHWSWWRFLDPVVMTSDGFDRGSLPNLQVLFFVELVGFGLTDLVLRTGALSDVSPAIVYLLGIPAVGTLGNQVAALTRDRISTGNWAWLVSKGVLPVNDPGKVTPQWSDLIMSETVLDLPKLQALTFSVIVGVAMVAAGFRNFANFSVPTNLLEILGLSQLVFVGGRFTRPTKIGDLDDILTELRQRGAAVKSAAVTGHDVDKDGKPVAAPVKAKIPIVTLAQATAPQGVPNAVQRYRETADQAKVLLEAMAHRSIDSRVLDDPLS